MTNSPELPFNSFGEDMVLTPHLDRYANGRLAITFLYYDDEMDMYAPFAKVTVNMPDDHLNEGEFFVKDWSENAPLIEYLVSEGWLIHQGREVLSGFIAPGVYRAAGPLLAFISAS